MIYSENNGYELCSKGISFKGVRMHGGNDHQDTEGCPLVAKSKVNNDKIYGSMETELTALLDKLGGEGFITVINS